VGAAHQRRESDGLPEIILSDCHLYSRINRGGDNGSLLIDGYQALARDGVSPRKISDGTTEYTLPSNFFNRSQVNPKWIKIADQEATHHKSWEPMLIPKDYASFKIALASCLARDIPVIHAWHVGNSSMRLNGEYVIQGRGPGNHATFFHSAKWVGGNDLVHPDMQNSWGPTVDEMLGPRGASWGNGGFGMFTMESAFQCRQHHEFWALVSTKIDARESPLKG
jgi:hypothetical protein